jgi:ADP-heptose:LPS heptosyltransferase
VLVAEGHRVAVTGSAGEESLCNAVVDAVARPEVSSLAGRLDLGGLAGLVAGARLLVCGDTGVAHLATAYGTPSVLLFGPTAPDRWGPVIDTDRHTVIWHGDGSGDPHADQVDPALRAITVEEVVTAAVRLLAARVTV